MHSLAFGASSFVYGIAFGVLASEAGISMAEAAIMSATVFSGTAQMAVLQGDPGGPAMFTVRLRMPDGYRIPSHTHPTDEIVTVISGNFRVGMGKTFDPKTMLTLKAGGFITAPANGAHYAAAQGETVVQVHAMGPFAMTYVNPADTPKPAAKNR